MLRGDSGKVLLGSGSNVQDRCVVVGTEEHDAEIKDDVTVGHCAVIRGARVEPRCVIGMQSVIEEGSVIGPDSIVGAGAVVAAGTRVGPKELWAGSPAKRVRELTPAELEGVARQSVEYSRMARRHAAEFHGHGTQWTAAEKLLAGQYEDEQAGRPMRTGATAAGDAVAAATGGAKAKKSSEGDDEPRENLKPSITPISQI